MPLPNSDGTYAVYNGYCPAPVAKKSACWPNGNARLLKLSICPICAFAMNTVISTTTIGL